MLTMFCGTEVTVLMLKSEIQRICLHCTPRSGVRCYKVITIRLLTLSRVAADVDDERGGKF